MFTILDDTIYFKGEPFATISPKAYPTLLARAIEAIELSDEWDSLVDDHEEEINKAYREGYAEAKMSYEGLVDQLHERIDSIREAIGAAPIS